MARLWDTATINLALGVLAEVVPSSSSRRVDSTEVRLALRVLQRYVGDHKHFTEFWDRAGAEIRHPWASCRGPYRCIVQLLECGGWAIEEKLKI